MLSTTCKFKVHSITRSTDGDSLTAYPVSDGTEEDKAFHVATPCGSLQLSGVKPGVLSFEVGDKLYVRIEKADQ